MMMKFKVEKFTGMHLAYCAHLPLVHSNACEKSGITLPISNSFQLSPQLQEALQ